MKRAIPRPQARADLHARNQLDIPGLRSWRVSDFPLIWFYFEREDFLDVVRLLGERQDIMAILDAN